MKMLKYRDEKVRLIFDDLDKKCLTKNQKRFLNSLLLDIRNTKALQKLGISGLGRDYKFLGTYWWNQNESLSAYAK